VDTTVQWIQTSSTKHSRGGEPATRRNAAPVGFTLPAVPSPSAHVVRMHERDGFNMAYGPVDADVFLAEPAVYVPGG
jgi:hypothetical protein